MYLPPQHRHRCLCHATTTCVFTVATATTRAPCHHHGRVCRLQLVASMNAATTVGRHPLSMRFTASVRVLVCDYPDAAELGAVYESLLGAAFATVPGIDAK
jgi:hypothetical protein